MSNGHINTLLSAVSFAARAHQGQLRKDKQTPYVSHVYRVCLIIRHIFAIGDSRILTAAVLHDTIEDTTTDFDDIAEQFDAEIARWVALLSKDKRLEETEREVKYIEQLVNAPWQVQVCKLADVYDNLTDSQLLDPDQRAAKIERTKRYFEAIKQKEHAELQEPLRIVGRLIEDITG